MKKIKLKSAVLFFAGTVMLMLSACTKKTAQENTAPVTVEPVVVEEPEPEEEIIYQGTLLNEYEKDGVLVQERFLTGSFKFYDNTPWGRKLPEGEDGKSVYDSVEDRNCIYNLSEGEILLITGFRRDLNLELSEYDYWIKVKVNETEGWLHVVKQNRPIAELFEDDYWVPYKETFVVDGVSHEYTIRKMSAGVHTKWSLKLRAYPDYDAPVIAEVKTKDDPFEEQRHPTYVGLAAMTTNQDFEKDKYYSKTWFLVEKDGVSGWTILGSFDHGERGGPLINTPVYELEDYLSMGA